MSRQRFRARVGTRVSEDLGTDPKDHRVEAQTAVRDGTEARKAEPGIAPTSRGSGGGAQISTGAGLAAPGRVWLLPIVIAVVGLLLAGAGVLAVSKHVGSMQERRLEKLSKDIGITIDRRVALYTEALYGLRGLFTTRAPVSRNEFHSFLSAGDFGRRYAGVQALEFTRLVSAQDKQVFEDDVRRDTTLNGVGYPEFRIHPDVEPAEYFVVDFVEPMEGNEAAFGFDLGSNPVRLEAVNEARDTGVPIVTGSIRLVQEQGAQRGFLLLVAVYDTEPLPATVSERRTAFQGFVNAVFRVGDMLTPAVEIYPDASIEVYDLGPTDRAGSQTPGLGNLLFDNDVELSVLFSSSGPGLTHFVDLDVGGRRWRVMTSSPGGLITPTEQVAPWIVGGAGISLSLAMAFLAFFLFRSRRSEKAVRGSKERLQAILGTASDAVVSVDENQRIILFNQQAEKMFGYLPEEVLGGPISMLLPDRFGDAHTAHVDGFAEGEVTQRLMSSRSQPLCGLRRNGVEFPTEITISKLELAGQRILTAIVRDRTAQAEAEQAQRESEERYRDLFERSPIALWEEDFTAVGSWLDALRDGGVGDLRGYLAAHPDQVDHSIGLVRILNANPAAAALIGVQSREQLLGGFPQEALTEDVRQSFVEEFVAIWEQRDRFQFELTGSTFGGDRIDCVLHWAAHRGDDQLDLSHVIIAIADITERKAIEARLEQLLRSKDELIASVSHELRTPLTAVVGFAELLRDEQSILSPTDRSEMLASIASQGTDLANIVDDLLVAARVETDTLTMVRVSVDLWAQAAQVLEASKQESLVPVSGDSVRAVGDPARVRQIVRNLVSNAFRYGGDQIQISIGQVDSWARLEVRDNGPGIPEDQRDRIFEPYLRAHHAPGVTAAVGLGLAVSRKLGQLMGGDLTYRYQQEQSIFQLTLPIEN